VIIICFFRWKIPSDASEGIFSLHKNPRQDNGRGSIYCYECVPDYPSRLVFTDFYYSL